MAFASRRPAMIVAAGTAVAALAAGLAACGSQGVQVAQDNPDHAGAVLFAEHCSGCHTLDAAGTQGSSNPGDRTSGPNFNTLKEDIPSVLYAIRNGGFSGAIMPANIVVGGQAAQIATFVAKYAGKGAAGPPTVTPSTTPTTPTTPPAGKAEAAVFKQNCGACHTLAAAGTTGKVGPNLDQAKPTEQQILAALASGPAEMPANLLTGAEAKAMAAYVAAAEGKQAKKKPAQGGGQALNAQGKTLFTQKCGTCHTLKSAGTTGSAGPNLDQLRPDAQTVLAAIAAGPGIMPPKLYTGKQAKLVAAYVAQVAGK